MKVFQPELAYWQGALVRSPLLGVSAEGRLTRLEGTPAGAELERLPGRLLLPGLVNAHSHAFQRLLRGRTEYAAAGAGRDDFWSWRELMYQAAERLTPEQLHRVSRQAFVEMARAGITSVGEFHYLQHAPDGTPYPDRLELSRAVVRAAREAGVRITLLRVGYARAGHGVAENPRQRRFIDPDVKTLLGDVRALARAFADDPAVRVGVAPHSVRAVPRAWLEALAEAQPELAAIHMHVSEQPKEIEACLAEHGLRPVELLHELGLLGPRFTAVHGIHLSPHEVQLLGAAGANVCACPTTEANLGDGVIPADALLEAGASVCLGSDSQARIDLLEEARRLEEHLRLVRQQRAVLDAGGGRVDGLARRLLDAATRAGAASIGQEGGVLQEGAPADFFAVDLEHPSLCGADEESLLAAVVFGAAPDAITEVAVGGRLVVQGGRHPLQDDSARAFAAVSQELFGIRPG